MGTVIWKKKKILRIFWFHTFHFGFAQFLTSSIRNRLPDLQPLIGVSITVQEVKLSQRVNEIRGLQKIDRVEINYMPRHSEAKIEHLIAQTNVYLQLQCLIKGFFLYLLGNIGSIVFSYDLCSKLHDVIDLHLIVSNLIFAIFANGTNKFSFAKLSQTIFM